MFVSGLLFLALTLLGVRTWLAEAISPSLKHSFAVGIGLFLALIGLYETGIVTSGAAGMPAAALSDPGGLLRPPAVPLKIGDLRDPHVLLAVAGLLFTAILLQRRVRGALLIGIAATAAVGFALGMSDAPRRRHGASLHRGPESCSAIPEDGRLGALQVPLFPAVLTLFIMGFLDTLGTLVGLGAAGELLDEKGRFPEIEKPMLVDALSCVFAGAVGTTTSGAYIESAAGIREGAEPASPRSSPRSSSRRPSSSSPSSSRSRSSVTPTRRPSWRWAY